MSKDSEQDFEGADESDTGPPRRGRAPTARERPFKLGPLGNLNQVTKALGKTIRAMADGSATVRSELGFATGSASCGPVSKQRPWSGSRIASKNWKG